MEAFEAAILILRTPNAGCAAHYLRHQTRPHFDYLSFTPLCSCTGSYLAGVMQEGTRPQWVDVGSWRILRAHRRERLPLSDACRGVTRLRTRLNPLIPTDTLISFAAEPKRTAVVPSLHAGAHRRLGTGERIEGTLAEVR